MVRHRGADGGHTTAPRPSPSDPPDNWPADVAYLSTSSCPSPGLSPEHTRIFCSSPPTTSPYHPATLRSQDWTVITRITDYNHPAHGQFGLFAKKAIPPRTTLLLYLGQVHTEEESDQQSDYDLGVWAPSSTTSGAGQDDTQLGIDATKMGNEARFVNDYRGIAQRANVEFQEYEIPAEVQASPSGPETEAGGNAFSTTPLRGLFFQSASKEIKPGEELLTTYGKGYWAARRREIQNSRLMAGQEQDGMKHCLAPTVNTGTQAKPSPADHVHALLERQRARLQTMKAKT